MPTFDTLSRIVPAALAVLLALPSGGGIPAPEGDDPADTLRVVAYNIHHGEGMDGAIDLERIAALIRGLRPDLVALQEVDSVVARTDGVDQARELGRMTGLTSVFGRFMPYQGGAYGMAVLSRWPVVQVRNVRLPDGDEPRSSVVVTVRSPSTGRLLRFSDVHFYRTEEERMAQARALVDSLAATGPVIMAGDFNSTPDSPIMAFLADAWRALDKGEDRLTFSSFDPVREIDYVLVRPDSAFNVLEHRVLDEPVASDHRPLVAEIVWR